ncbi:MAG: hypothetical protein A2236_12855 [Bacteroidetes bacterium RIFOXYA2_FULL_33_7]|nr:MAG: hypothetical protein A2265_07820 [Bacteroidetes bacterium RIFOXYA12_FULL_33_9]OFY86256.1 MAG: hypothetical protein A2236_12855 [Bacteroidetes bacterium RIFOXYA2_FULL_33_7]
MSIFSQHKVDIKIDVNEFNKGDTIQVLTPSLSFVNFDTTIIFQNPIEIKKINRTETEIRLRHKNSYYTFHVENEDEFFLHFYNLSEMPLIEGKNTDKAKLLSEFQFKYSDLFSYSKQPIEVGIDEYENSLYLNMKQQIDFINNYNNAKDLSLSSKSYLYNLVKYNYLNRLFTYSIQDTHPKSIKSLPTIMLNIIKPDLVSNDAALYIENYRLFLDKYMVYSTFKENEFSPINDRFELIKSILVQAYSQLNGQTKTYYIANILTKYHTFISEETFTNYVKLISSDSSYINYKTSIENTIKKNTFYKVQELEKSKPELKEKESNKDNSNSSSNKLSLIDTKGKKIRLSDFKGKVIYIDVWASWCGPCRQQFPYAKDLQKKFTDKEKEKIVFLYISIDENETIWKNALEKIEIHGTNLLSPGGWNSDVTKHFQIRSIPRYLLIDKSGKVVDNNAKRPSQTEEIYNEIINLITN